MKHIILLVMFWLGICQVVAQKLDRPDSYNYQRGLEAMQEEKKDEAIDYFNKDLKDYPKNGYSFAWIAHLRLLKEDYGRALTAADLALKYLPKKDTEYLVFAYTSRAITYLNLQDTLKAINDYTAAIKASPETASLYEKRAQVYYELRKYELADADYRKMTDLNPGDVMGFMGLGRNAKTQERWNDAIRQFDYVTKLDNNYSSAYSFRAESYIGLGRFKEAVDDIITALSIDGDQKAYYLMQDIANNAFPLLKTKLEIQCTKNPNDQAWPYYLALVFERRGLMKKAIEYYKKSADINSKAIIYERIASCYDDIGEYDLAMAYLDKALQLEPNNLRAKATKADVLYESGHVEEAIKELDFILSDYPDWTYGYHRRGWFKENGGYVDGAIDDYTTAITLNPEDAYSFFCRGKMYEKRGNASLAKEDYMKAIELDTEPNESSVAQFAYYHLGQKEKAIDFMNRIIDNTNGDYYDAACLYSIMGEKEKALDYLRMAFSHGYRRFAHLAIDADLDNIRNLPAFKEMIQEYKEKHQRELKEYEEDINDNKQEKQTITTEVPFTKEGGVCKVKCSINNLPLHFVFDTGASDVTLSMVEANFMLKNDYLTEKDIIGNQHYMDANGDISVGTVVNLRTVVFGDLELNNVRASVVRNQKAPLLLGQSVLSRIGKIEIDNENNVIKVTRTSNF
jgi:clan AA aspartic protease (TIGR02281 family)